MTYREQAIKDLEDIIATAEGIKGLSDDAGITISLDKLDALKMATTALKQERALKNRCYVSSQGLVCAFCPMECEHKGE